MSRTARMVAAGSPGGVRAPAPHPRAPPVAAAPPAPSSTPPQQQQQPASLRIGVAAGFDSDEGEGEEADALVAKNKHAASKSGSHSSSGGQIVARSTPALTLGVLFVVGMIVGAALLSALGGSGGKVSVTDAGVGGTSASSMQEELTFLRKEHAELLEKVKATAGAAADDGASRAKEEASGTRALFYSAPQHNVRYPATMPYLQKDSPLCHYTPDPSRSPTSRDELEQCLGRERATYKENPLAVSKMPCNERRKVYDTLRYNGEDVLLETRMEENWNVVDYFVIIESPMAFSGIRKKMDFNEAARLGKYDKYMSKVIHVVCELSHIEVADDNEKNALRGWPREYATTDCLKFALAAAHPDDIIVYADSDQITRPEIFHAMQRCSFEMSILAPKGSDHSTHREVDILGPRFLGNWKWEHYPGFPHNHWGPRAMLRRTFFDKATLALRPESHNGGLVELRDAQWHCSMCFFEEGAVEKVIHKLDTWSELGATEWIKKRMLDKSIKSSHENCGDSDEASKCTLWSDTTTLPKFVQDHPERFRDKGYAA